ncbi:LysR family transcriptional regulator [Steroidobacter sp.]|uniref:LysR family transcriptional regulator n=1 Tax=Steroidobacter sp. TaxID=1978227 RepID=UPI001A633DC4|nr:LysR family transcriptional regulator [Steroidobacter sp.]MBL8269145.1 LysR family transcriptional regulator [Steroidobacter sp.]
MDIADVDLNLLVVFDALLRARSVSGAARALKMSQPATSFALNRLRKMFGEPLFVRTSRGIHPTPFAESLTAPLEAILDRIRSDLLQQPSFDPATERRSVTFNMQDIGELVFLPRILARLNEIAPGLQLRTVNLPAPLLEPALRSGEVDIALGHYPDLTGAALFQQRLFSHSFVCIVRADHPTIKDEMTRRQFLDGVHAVVHPAGYLNDSLETELQAQGLTRKVSVRIEHFLAVPTILMQSNLIFTVPYAIGAGLAKLADITLVKPPFKAKPRVIRQHWHTRFQHDGANRWLRSVVAELFIDKETRPKSRATRR